MGNAGSRCSVGVTSPHLQGQDSKSIRCKEEVAAWDGSELPGIVVGLGCDNGKDRSMVY